MSLRNAVLAELARSPGRAFAIYRRLRDEIGEFWQVNDGHVFQVLQTGEAKGWVTSAPGEDDRPVYSLTEDGRALVDDWLAEPEAGVRPQRDDLYLRLLYCTGDPPSGLGEAVRDQLHQTARTARRLRERLADLDAADPPDELSILVLEGALSHLQADVDWLRRVEEVLDGWDGTAVR